MNRAEKLGHSDGLMGREVTFILAIYFSKHLPNNVGSSV